MSNAPADDNDTGLLDIVRERIARHGPMPVDQYIHLCLAHPEHGYWHKADSIGAGGDFITAPEISQVFGELIGLWCAVVWQGMGRPSPVRLVELGPGRGTLMRDALRAAERVPGFIDAAGIHLIEISPALREIQRRLLPPPLWGRGREGGIAEPQRHEGERKHASIFWHETLDEAPAGPTILVANEFLDSLPIRQLVFTDGLWRERVIEIDASGTLRFSAGAAVDCPEEMPAPPEPGAILELRAGEERLLAELANRPAPITALFIDYGPAEPAIGDTLQAVRRHAYVDPLRTPGSADLTAHVRFAAAARKARQAGFAVDGPTTQAEFLGRLGIAERAARLMAANPARAREIEAGAQRLMSPTGMGGLFKVLAVRSRHLPRPPAFL
jgi:NADH dehydrogenase [ubiquinone] 1 alpha subcomplex assembly factor 7